MNTEDIILKCPRLHSKSLKKREISHIRVFQVPEWHKKDIHLKIMVSLDKDGVRDVDECSALIDTGAEMFLIRQGLLPKFLFQPDEIPLWLIAVNKQRLAGGEKEVLITMLISGIHMIEKKAVEMRISIWVYSADIREDIVLSYEWCQLRGGDISARKHGLLCIKSGQ